MTNHYFASVRPSLPPIVCRTTTAPPHEFATLLVTTIPGPQAGQRIALHVLARPPPNFSPVVTHAAGGNGLHRSHTPWVSWLISQPCCSSSGPTCV